MVRLAPIEDELRANVRIAKDHADQLIRLVDTMSREISRFNRQMEETEIAINGLISQFEKVVDQHEARISTLEERPSTDQQDITLF